MENFFKRLTESTPPFLHFLLVIYIYIAIPFIIFLLMSDKLGWAILVVIIQLICVSWYSLDPVNLNYSSSKIWKKIQNTLL